MQHILQVFLLKVNKSKVDLLHQVKLSKHLRVGWRTFSASAGDANGAPCAYGHDVKR